MTRISFTLNGRPVAVDAAPTARLSRTLRESCGAREVKVGCDAGDCGACTVLVDDLPVCACLMATGRATGARIDTLAGLAGGDPVATRLVRAFHDHGAAQCGICTPGMIVAATALLRERPAPTEDEVMTGLGGVLCRCTGYRKIVEAVLSVGGATPAPMPGSGAVGTTIARLDGLAKVEGREAFGDDVAPPGTLELRVIRSPHARATFEFGDITAFLASRPGLVAVLTAQDVPGQNRFGVIPAFEDQPVFARKVALYRGDAVAAVVGTPEAMAAFDDDHFPIRWHAEPAATSPEAAQSAQAPLLHADHPGNVMTGGRVQTGDADAALARADLVIEARFRTCFVEHAYIEPEAGYALVRDGRVEVHACTQAPVMDQESLAKILALPKDRIRIVPTAVGGGFGSKLDLSVQPFLALAAIKTGQPVRLVYSRGESMAATTKRHPADIRLRIGATRDGRVCGFDFHGTFDTGAYASWGPTVANRVPVHASGPYRIADYRAVSTAIYTNNPPAGAFRGFGVPQSAIAQEVLFDELAEALGIDPLDFRLRNALEDGAPTVCGQVFDRGVGIRACLEALRDAWDRERATARDFNAGGGALKRGVGLAAGWYGCGNTSLPNPSTIRAGIRPDGRIFLHQGAMDIGQGANTVIAQIFAESLGVPVSLLNLIGPDTDLTPDAGKTSASRQTFVSGNAARLSGLSLRATILRQANAGDDARLHLGPGWVEVRDGAAHHRIDLTALPCDAQGYALSAQETYDPPTRPLDRNGQGHPYAQFGYAAHLAVVEVDTTLGLVRPVRFVAAHDVGRAINPMLVEGQVHGGIAQGLGMALMEEYIPGRTENLHDYLIPTIGDIPPIQTIIVEQADAHGPFGAKGLGEHVLIPTAPAILNAIRHATGARMRRVPATPDRVLQAIKEVTP